MATLRLTLEGEPRRISLRSFVQASDSALKIVQELDAAISQERGGLLDWVVTDLTLGSLVIVAQSFSRVPDHDPGPAVTRAFVGGLRQIEDEGTTPPYLTEGGLRHVRRLIKLIGHDGTRGLRVADLEATVALTARAAANVEPLMKIRHKAIGSIEGKLDTSSVHRAPRFIVYQSRTKKAVTCRFETGLLESAKAALGRRVLVAGIIHSNVMDEPVRVDAERIRPLRQPSELPGTSDLAGSDADFTGGVGSAEYVRRLRGA